jgi:plastocyanin
MPKRAWRRFFLFPLVLVAAQACEREAPAPLVAEDSIPGLFQAISRPGDGGQVHLVRLIQRGDSYAFEPAELTIPSNEVVRFVMVGAQPESVAFDTVAGSPEVLAYIRSNGLHRGPLLTDSGQTYDVTFRDAPIGRYRIYSLPHADLGMRGSIIVEAAAAGPAR